MRIGWVFSFRDEFLAKSWHLEHIWDGGADIVKEFLWASRHVEDSDQMYGCWWNMASRQKVTAYSVSTLPLAGRNSANMCSERGPVGFLGKKKKCGFYATMWTRPVKTNKRDIEQWFSTDESHPKSGLEQFSLALWAISLFYKGDVIIYLIIEKMLGIFFCRRHNLIPWFQ